MPTRQAVTVIVAVARALGMDAEPTAFTADLRRDGRLPATLDELAEQVVAIAQRVDLTVLTRDRALLGDLAAAEALPIVLLVDRADRPADAQADGRPESAGRTTSGRSAVEGGPPRFEAYVLERREGGAVIGVRVDREGNAEPASAPAAAIVESLLGADAGRAVVRVLVPVNVTASVGGPDADPRWASAAAHHSGGLAGGEAADGPSYQPHAGPSPVARLWGLLVRERRDIWLVFGYAALAGLFSLALPLSIQQIVQLVSGRMLLQPTYILVAFVLLGTLGVGALQVMQLAVVENIQQRVFTRLALEFSFRVPRLRYDVALREDLPEVMNRFFETVIIQKSLSKLLLDLSAALLTILFGLVLLTLYHPYFTFFSAALVVGLGVILWLTGPKGLDTSVRESKYKYKVVHWLEEMARANTAFKFAGRSALPVERMDELVSGYLKYRKLHFRVLVQQTISVVGFKTLIVGTLLVLGIALVQGNQITLGQFVASEIIIITVLAGIEKLISSLATVYDILTAVDKLGHVTDLPLEATGGLALPAASLTGASVAAGARGGAASPALALSARGLTFRYAPGAEPAVDDLALEVRPGERVGITGYEGSGQTTLLKLLGGLLDGYEGAVAVNGMPLRDLDRVAYRAAVGQLLSPDDLFDGTVEENITVGRAHISPTDVLRALDRVGLGDWVQQQPSGLRTPISNGGRALPTHVVSRLLMAQAVVGRPRLVVVDDYYQNIEPDSRQHLVQCLMDRSEPWTLLLVSHDPQFLAACDRVLVLEDGRIVRDGPFDRLVSESPFLQSLVRRGQPFAPPARAELRHEALAP
jgi:ABC-type bacteriocin/lantibiotic exporter with double-glycine peptidase domain